MELFSELYSTYYRAIRHVLQKAAAGPLSAQELQHILLQYAFSESAYHILPKLQNEDWPLLQPTADGYIAACVPPEEMPLTFLQLTWLKAMISDPRIGLFLRDEALGAMKEALLHIPTLYRQEDFYVFDRARDGDDYTNEQYREHFQAILCAIHEKSAVYVRYESGHGGRMDGIFWPYQILFSSKDDKFRILCHRNATRHRKQYVLNLARIISLRNAGPDDAGQQPPHHHIGPRTKACGVTLEITRERNALERCMIQFAHFEKRTEYDVDTDTYTCVIQYDPMDETELLIRILSFGPTVRVLAPAAFRGLMRERVDAQAALLQKRTV